MKCERCGGSGNMAPDYKRTGRWIRCSKCDGTGEKPESQSIFDNYSVSQLHRMYGGVPIRSALLKKTPAPPEESQDERIREAFEKWYNANDWNTIGVPYSVPKVAGAIIFKAGFKSRDEEVERLGNELEYSFLDYELLKSDFTALRAQIEEMKCCGNCGIEQTDEDCNIDSMLEHGVTAFICDNWKRRSDASPTNHDNS